MPLLLLWGCGTATPAPEGISLLPDESAVLVYQCQGEHRFIIRVLQDSVRVQYETTAATLGQIPAASGRRYGGEGFEFWSRGAEARLHTPTGSLDECRGTRANTPWEVARLLSYELRGLGQEPGWLVEIDLDRRMHVLADYGAIEFFTGRPVAGSAADAERLYRADSEHGEVVVTVRPAPCEDTMSGELFPAVFTLAFGGRRLEGCGRSLSAELKIDGVDPEP